MTEQRPEVHPGFGEDLAEENGFADEARQIFEDENALDQTQPPDEASTPV